MTMTQEVYALAQIVKNIQIETTENETTKTRGEL